MTDDESVGVAGADEDKPRGNAPDPGKAHLRVARPTNDLVALIKFHRVGLGFDVLYHFVFWFTVKRISA